MRHRPAVGLALPAPAAGFAQTLAAITGATLWDGSGSPPLEDAVVLVRDGLVVCAGDRVRCPIPERASILNANERWVIPGLVDSHIHWQVWYDAERRLSPEEAARAARVYLANGVTTVIDVGGQYWVRDEHRQVLEDLARSALPAPGMLFSGWVDRRDLDRSGSAAGERTRGLLEGGVDGVKIHNGLTLEEIEAVVQEADAAGVPVYGHTYGVLEEALVDYTSEAVVLGVDGIFHVLGIPPIPSASPLLRPDLSPEDWESWWLAGADLWNHVTEADVDRLVAAMVGGGAWLQPTLVTEEAVVTPGWLRGDPAWRYSPLSWEMMMLGWPRFGEDELAIYRSAYGRMKTFVRRFHENGGVLLAGTDGVPVPGFGLHEELYLLVQSGISSKDALLAATRNPARAWGREDRFGVLAQGASADLLILDGDPLADIRNTRRIWRVMRRGVLYDPTELLEGSEANRTDPPPKDGGSGYGWPATPGGDARGAALNVPLRRLPPVRR